jgi:hypothetical protein
MFTPPAGTWTTGQTAILAALVLTTLVAVLGDAYTTMAGLAKGLAEGNPVMKFFFSKIGQSLTAFLSAVAVLAFGTVVAAHSLGAAYVFFGGVTIAEGIVTLRNYLKLKAAKISLK